MRHLKLSAILAIAVAAGMGLAVDAGAAPVTPVPRLQNATPGIMLPPFPYRPKDFAFIHAQGLFHLFYMRHAMDVAHDDSNEVDFGHAVSQDLGIWIQLDPILHVRPGKWDDLHVWAPTIIEKDGVYYLFYTGVSRVPYHYQRIGVATSTDLENWERYDAPVFGGNQVPWAFADSSQFNGCQFRDPFVMEDPGQAGQWLMYFSAAPKAAPGQLIVGIGRNGTGLSPWQDLKPLWNTDAAHYVGYTESSHVFSHDGRWYLFFTTNSGHPIRYQYSTSPTADSTGWSQTWRLFDNDAGADSWFASEFLRVGSHEYLAAVNSSYSWIEIREMNWTGPASFTLSAPTVTAVPGEVRGQEGGPSLTALGSAPGDATIRFRVVLPSAMRAAVSVHDLAGRRVRSLHAGILPGGATEFAWDRKDDGGRNLAAGMYVARLQTILGSRSAKAAVLR